jgi:hypothetical protein
MGVCIYPNSVCQDNAAAINVHRSVGLSGNLSSSLNEKNIKNKISLNYQIKDIGSKIKISLIFFCSNEILKNSFTYKFKLFIDNSDMEEENFIPLGSTEATICQSQIKYKKIFETHYFFSKGQRIKICCLENEKNINESLFYLGKMINGFDNPKLIIEKDNEKIGELLILINKENNIKNKKCIFFIEILNKTKFPDKTDLFFTINKHSGEVIYISEIFNSENNIGDNSFKCYYQIRKHLIFDKSNYIIFNLYKLKEIKTEPRKNNDLNNEIKDIEKQENIENKISILENELIDSISISYNELINNNGTNIFTINKGLLSYFRNESVTMQIYYKETDYTSFFEYISCQLHLNLILIINKEVLIKYNSKIKQIINIFHSLISLYNNEVQKFIYLKNKNIKKNNNYQDFYDDIINDESEVINSREIFPDIDYLYNKYINLEMSKGINKYFIVLIFTDQKFGDLNSDLNYNLKINFPNYDIYNNSPINFKIFNFGDKSNYIEKNDININIYKNINEDIKYNRIIFQYYNINNEVNYKKKLNKYLNDIPYLIEDYFEIQKLGKFSIFDE